MIEKRETFDIEGLLLITPKVYCDERGYFTETFNCRDFAELGITNVFVQDNESKSVKNVVRGLHFQEKNPQAKLVRVIKGEVYDVAVDLRADSKTYGKWQGVVLSAENRKQFYVPRGFAHGFAVISEEAVFCYKCDNYWVKSDERGILWNDRTLNIDWGRYVDIGKAIISEKDKLNVTFDEWTQKSKKAGCL